MAKQYWNTLLVKISLVESNKILSSKIITDEN